MDKKDLAVAIDFGATNLRIGLVDVAGNILEKRVKSIPFGNLSENEISNHLLNEIKDFLHEQGQENINRVKGVGMSVAGFVDSEKGLFFAPNIGGGKSIAAVDSIKKEICPFVIMYNDCNAAVLGEKIFGSDREKNNIVYLTISSGIGAGVVSGGRVMFGKNNGAGEVGHFVVDSTYNLSCGCGAGTGHWESLASGKNMPKFFEVWKASKEIISTFDSSSSEYIFSEATKGNIIALEFIEDLGKINGRGVTNIIRSYDPEVIILSGSIVLHNENLIIDYLKKNLDAIPNIPEIKISSLGEDAPLLGAAAAIFSETAA
jgi:glucokinase